MMSEREKFESQLVGRTAYRPHDYGDRYYDPSVQEQWIGWQARAAIAASQQAAPKEMTSAAIDILTERQRQIDVEGWTPKHDDEHADGQMASAAGCYALHTEPLGNVGDYLRFWPWDGKWWKPTDRRTNLIKAAALILAEIERIDRAALASLPPTQEAQNGA